MSKSTEKLTTQQPETKPSIGNNLRRLKEGVVNAYQTADQAVIKATTFDSKKAMKGLQRAAILALGVGTVGIGIPNMEKANAANNESKSGVPTVEQLVSIEANKSDSGVSKGGVAKGLNSVMQDGKFTKEEVATFVKARNDGNGFRDKNKNESDTKAILAMVNSGKNILQATSEVVFASPEAQAQAAKDAAAGTKTDAETYGKLVADAQQKIMQKQTEQKSSSPQPSPVTSPNPSVAPTTPSNPSSGPNFKGFPVGSLLKNAENIVGAIIPKGESASAAVIDSKLVKLDRVAVFNTMKQRRIEMRANKDATYLSVSDNIDDITRGLFPGISREDRENYINRIQLRPYIRSLTLDLQSKDRSAAAAARIEKTFTLIANTIDNSTIPIEITQKVEGSKTTPEDQTIRNAIDLLLGSTIIAGLIFTLRNGKKLKIANTKIDSKNRLLTENANEINSLNDKITKKDETIARKDGDIVNLDTEIAQLAKAAEGDSQYIDSLKNNNKELTEQVQLIEKALREQTLEKDRKIESLEAQISAMKSQLGEMRRLISSNPEIAASIAVQRESQKEILNKIKLQLRGLFAKAVSEGRVEDNFEVKKTILDKLEGIDGRSGHQNMMDSARRAAREQGYEISGDSQQDGSLKIYITKKLEVNANKSEDDDIFADLDELLGNVAKNPLEIDDDSDLELEPELTPIKAPEQQLTESIEQKPNFEVFDVADFTRDERWQFSLAFRDLSSRRDDENFEHTTSYFNLVNDPNATALRKVYPNILSEMYSYFEGKYQPEILNKFFNESKTDPGMFVSSLPPDAIPVLNQIIIKLKDKIRLTNVTEITPKDQEKLITDYSQQAIQRLIEGESVSDIFATLTSIPLEIRSQVLRNVRNWDTQNRQNTSTTVATNNGQKITVVSMQPKPSAEPAPVPSTQPARSVNSAPAAPNQPEAPRHPTAPKYPESQKTLVDGPAKVELKKLQQMLEMNNDLESDQLAVFDRVIEILNVLTEITASQTKELMQIKKVLPLKYANLAVEAWQENKRKHGAI
jgi:hypothetical protein